MPALDSTVLIDADRNDPRLRDRIKQYVEKEDPLIVPIQAAIEYSTGRKDPAEGLRRLRQSFWVVECDPEIALEAARLAKHAIQNGRFPGWADVQIAATARILGVGVLTRNIRHFEDLDVHTETY